MGPLAGSNIATFVIEVGDLDVMVRFYHDTLGLAVEQHTANYAELRAKDGAAIAFHRRPGVAAGRRGWFVEFKVDDIAATASALRARGVAVGDVQHRAFGMFAEFLDPEGNRLELEGRNNRFGGSKDEQDD